MRREILYLTDIIEAADHIAAFTADLDFKQFQQSEMVRSAVVQKLAIIGEAAARISPEIRNQEPQIAWGQIVALRNVLVHAYFGTDWDEVWRIARNRCPVLREQIAKILTAISG